MYLTGLSIENLNVYYRPFILNSLVFFFGPAIRFPTGYVCQLIVYLVIIRDDRTDTQLHKIYLLISAIKKNASRSESP